MNPSFASSSLAPQKPSHKPSEVVLNEVHDLQQKVQDSSQISFLQNPERQFWQELVDSNIRVGSLACLWCIKAHMYKRLSAGFNKWKLVTTIAAVQERQKEENEKNARNSVDGSDGRYREDIQFPWEDRRQQMSSAVSTATSSILAEPSQPRAVSPTKSIYTSTKSALHDRKHQQELSYLEHETDGFEKLSMTLLDKDIEPDAKRKMLLNMSREVLRRSHQEAAQSSSSSRSPSSSRTSNGNSLTRPSERGSYSKDKETWNSYQQRESSSKRSSLDLLEKQRGQLTDTSANDEPSSSRFDFGYRVEIPPITTSSRPSSLRSSPSRVHHTTQLASQDELMTFLRFRRDAAGDFVKGLVSPRKPTSYTPRHVEEPTHVPPDRTHSNQNARYEDVLQQATQHIDRSRSRANSHSSQRNENHYLPQNYDAFEHQSSFSEHAQSRRSVSPQYRPSYLMTTTSMLKKSSTNRPASSGSARNRSRSPSLQPSNGRTRPLSAGHHAPSSSSSINTTPSRVSRQQPVQSSPPLYDSAYPHLNPSPAAKSSLASSSEHLLQHRRDLQYLHSALPQDTSSQTMMSGGASVYSSSRRSVASSSHHTSASKRSVYSTSSSQQRKMESAQARLLYGDLQDVGKKDWERTLRR